MRISVLTAFNSDPYIALLYKKSFQLWKDEIDELMIYCHGENEKIKGYIFDLFIDEPKCFPIMSYIECNELGQALDSIYSRATGDIIATIDSDNFILKKGLITKYTKLIDDGEYDIIGKKGFHCRPLEAGKEIIDKIGLIRVNSMFSFWNRKKIDEIEDMSFARVRLSKGDRIEEIDYTLEHEKLWIDTMGMLTIKCLAKGDKLLILDRPKDKEYVHVGGMSKMSRQLLRDKDDISIYGIKSNFLDLKFKKHKLAWHLFAYLETYEECDLKWFNEKYISSLDEKIHYSGFTIQEIMAEIDIIKKEYWKNING